MKKEEIKEDVLYNLAAPTWMDMKEDQPESTKIINLKNESFHSKVPSCDKQENLRD